MLRTVKWQTLPAAAGLDVAGTMVVLVTASTQVLVLGTLVVLTTILRKLGASANKR